MGIIRFLRQWREKADGTLKGPSLETEQLSNDLIFAGSFDGVDADARLDNALASASSGDVLQLEAETYAEDRTISTPLRITGTTIGPAGTTLEANWTFTVAGVVENIGFIDETSTIIISGREFKFINHRMQSNTSVVVQTSRVQLTGIQFGNVTFESGTKGCIIDSCTGVSVTDNGANTVGDVA